jgi:hypothetical protein
VKPLLCVLLLSSLSAAQSYTCVTNDKKPCTLNISRADKIYWYATAQVARTINPLSPPKLEPVIKLRIGDCNNANLVNPPGEGYVIRLRYLEGCIDKYSDERWAEIVAVAAATQSVKVPELIQAVKDALVFANAMVSTEELKEKR